MFQKKWLNLQLFAGEGAGEGGGEGAATGENAADPGRQRLLELGVPAEKLRKNRAYRTPVKNAPPVAAPTEQTKESPEQVAAANQEPTEQTTEEKKTDVPARMSWQEIMEDPEYNREMQAVVQSRLRSAKGAEETLGKLAPALELLARSYGQDPTKIDYEALAKSINDDESYYEDRAVEMGVSVNTAKRIDQQERDSARQQRLKDQMIEEQARTIQEQRNRQHLQNLERQAEVLKTQFPDFDLRTEMKNPIFARMTSPSGGLSLEAAYHAIHYKQIQEATRQVTAQQTALGISNAIRAGGMRPQENGTSGQAPSVTTFDYRSMSKEERDAFKARIRSGERIVPGMR